MRRHKLTHNTSVVDPDIFRAAELYVANCFAERDHAGSAARHTGKLLSSMFRNPLRHMIAYQPGAGRAGDLHGYSVAVVRTAGGTLSVQLSGSRTPAPLVSRALARYA
jgi:hypothetical protein